MLRAVLEGYHATIFAYGQTGSGKTFTMEGYDYEKSRDSLSSNGTRGAIPQARVESSTRSDRIGLIPRAIFTLFELIALASRDTSREFVIKCSFLQIYNEQILDLFNPGHFLHPQKHKPPSTGGTGARAAAASKAGGMHGLRLRWSAVRHFYVENLRVLECASPDQVLQHFQDGIKHKIMASHNLNAASSRSHCIFTLYVESFDPFNNPSQVLQSKLALVDLAGSERVDKTGATGVTLQESIGINKSLFVLRQVIQALSEDTSTGTSRERSYIPYRDSKLTSLLKYSLGGNSWTLMIACLSPSDAYSEENMSTLVYAAKAQSIANNPTKNEDPKTLLINQLKQEVESLRRQLAHAQEIILQFQQRPDGLRASLETNSKPSEVSLSVSIPTTHQQQPQEPAATPPLPQPTETTTTVKLKMNVIDNVELIKQLYTTEKRLNERVQKHEQRIDELQHETRVLNVENQSLREKIEVLEYLLQQNDRPEDSMDNTEASVQVIPGYGALQSTQSASALPQLSKSAEKMHAAITSKRGARPPRSSVRHENESAAEPDNQDQHAAPTRPQKASFVKQSQRKEGDAGLLSLSELRDLLGGRKMASPSSTVTGSRPPAEPPLPRGGVSRPSSNPSPSVPSIPVESNPTASLLSMLQQQRVETGRSVLEKDPLESLSELNRLLRVKATLRRSSSYK